METVVLYSFKSPNIKVTIEAYFNEAGSLVVDGYDIGKSQFNTNHCYSEIKNFLEKNQVQYESFTWN